MPKFAGQNQDWKNNLNQFDPPLKKLFLLLQGQVSALK
jgi:hypothetical protein